MHPRIAFALALFLVAPFGTARVEAEECTLFCAPALKLEPTFTMSNLFGGAAVAQLDGDEIVSVSREQRETAFEIIFALVVPTEIPRVGVTLEAGWKPFGRTDTNAFTGKTAEELGEENIRDNVVELELELNLSILTPAQTGGWVDMHFDIVAQLSPAARPDDKSVYTHKLDFELDTAFLVFQRLPEDNWIRNVEVELSLDYLATGIPKAGDLFAGGALYLGRISTPARVASACEATTIPFLENAGKRAAATAQVGASQPRHITSTASAVRDRARFSIERRGRGFSWFNCGSSTMLAEKGAQEAPIPDRAHRPSFARRE